MTGGLIPLVAEDGLKFDAYMVAPGQPTGLGIVLIQDDHSTAQGVGVTATALAARGFLVCVPDLGTRSDQNSAAEISTKETIKISSQAEDEFDYDQGVNDIAITVQAVSAHTDCNGTVAVVGYGRGGTLAYLAAARLDIGAAVAYYGSRIHHYVNEGRHLDCPMLFHLADQDDTHSPDDRSRIFAALIGIPHVSIYTYDARHGFSDAGRPNDFDADAAEQAQTRTLAVLDNLI